MMDPTRMKIVKIMDQSKMTAQQIAKEMGITSTKIHYHVKELERVGILVNVEKKTKGNMIEKYYQLISNSILTGPKLQAKLNEKEGDTADATTAVLLNAISFFQDEVVEFVNSKAFDDLLELKKNNQKEEKKNKKEKAIPINITVLNNSVHLNAEQVSEFSKEYEQLIKKYSKKGKKKLGHSALFITIPNPKDLSSDNWLGKK